MATNRRKKPQNRAPGCPQKEKSGAESDNCDVHQDPPVHAQPQRQRRPPNPPTPRVIAKLAPNATSAPRTLVRNCWIFEDDSDDNQITKKQAGMQEVHKQKKGAHNYLSQWLKPHLTNAIQCWQYRSGTTINRVTK